MRNDGHYRIAIVYRTQRITYRLILCDRRDVGSVSTTDHPQAETSALFIYDSYCGGVGLARNGYDHVEDLF